MRKDKMDGYQTFKRINLQNYKYLLIETNYDMFNTFRNYGRCINTKKVYF